MLWADMEIDMLIEGHDRRLATKPEIRAGAAYPGYTPLDGNPVA